MAGNDNLSRDIGEGVGLWQHLVAIAFCTFFTCVVLNPSIGGLTLYLWWFIPLLDPKYESWILRYLAKSRVRPTVIAGASVLVALCVIQHEWLLIVRLLALVLSLSYFAYMRGRQLYRWLLVLIDFNILWAIAQFVSYYAISPSFAKSIGPTAVANAVWGDYSTKTLTNFYEIFGGIIRVSGLSREAGFFASLLSIALVDYLFMTPRSKRSVPQLLLFVLGIVISFSKSSFAVPILAVIILSRMLLNRIQIPVVVVLWMAASYAVAAIVHDMGLFTQANESVVQRLGSPWFLGGFSAPQFLFGCGNLSTVANPDQTLSILISRSLELCGFSNCIQVVGILGFAVFTSILSAAGISSAGILIILVASITTSPFTSAPHMVLAYQLAILVSTRESIQLK